MDDGNFFYCLWSKSIVQAMPFKFEQLEVWQLSVAYIDLMYKIAEQLPRSEEFNLKSQMLRAATSAALNIAEGSTGQSDPEQRTFLGYSLRSLLETVACQFLISRRGYLSDPTLLREAYQQAQTLARKLQSMRKSIGSQRGIAREEQPKYETDDHDWLTTDDGQ